MMESGLRQRKRRYPPAAGKFFYIACGLIAGVERTQGS